MAVPKTPLLSVDIIIELSDREDHPIVLIARKHDPYGWAIPGGFVDIGERVEAAACREALEETGLVIQLSGLLGCYSDPRRDNRGHVVTLVYIAAASGQPQAADDAADLRICTPGEWARPLAFDHEDILTDYLHWRQNRDHEKPGMLLKIK